MPADLSVTPTSEIYRADPVPIAARGPATEPEPVVTGAPLASPRSHLDPSLGIVVIEFQAGAGSTQSIPTAAQLDAFKRAQLVNSPTDGEADIRPSGSTTGGAGRGGAGAKGGETGGSTVPTSFSGPASAALPPAAFGGQQFVDRNGAVPVPAATDRGVVSREG